MARKIDGYCQSHDNQEYLDRGNTVYVNRTPCTGKDPRCTVVVHSGKTERVFTESEVKAILHDMRSWISPDDGEEGRMWETRARLHGIVLDPA